MYEKLLPLLLLSLCSSCTKAIDRSAQSQERQPPLPSLAMVMQGETVEIQNDWNGYSDITPVKRHYKLRLADRGLVGNAHIAVGGYGGAGIRQQATTKIKIPAALSAQFLSLLAKTPIQTGKYQPTITRADDYPQIRIVVKSQQQTAIFSSNSQGTNNTPWKVTVGQEDQANDYVTNSPLPAQALKLLKPYLDPNGVDRIIQPRRT